MMNRIRSYYALQMAAMAKREGVVVFGRLFGFLYEIFFSCPGQWGCIKKNSSLGRFRQ